MPKSLALPSPKKLAAVNQGLEHEVANRQRAEMEIKRLNESLERRVLERTAELETANRELQKQILERQRAEEQFRLVVESSPNAMVMVNEEGKIVMVNSQTERLFGYEREELMGQPVDCLVPQKFRGSHPSHRSDFFGDPKVRPMGAGRDV